MMEEQTVFIVGGGGREHALAWKLSRSDLVRQIFVCPGNGGTAHLAKTSNVTVSASGFVELVAFAIEHGVSLYLLALHLIKPIS